MPTLYKDESYKPKVNAQRNLQGRTHYVDDDTLRFHFSRIRRARPEKDGLLFSIIESVALDYQNQKRGYRYVVFDIFGHVVSRLELEYCVKNLRAAQRELEASLKRIDAIAVNEKSNSKFLRDAKSEFVTFKNVLSNLAKKEKSK